MFNYSVQTPWHLPTNMYCNMKCTYGTVGKFTVYSEDTCHTYPSYSRSTGKVRSPIRKSESVLTSRVLKYHRISLGGPFDAKSCILRRTPARQEKSRSDTKPVLSGFSHHATFAFTPGELRHKTERSGCTTPMMLSPLWKKS